jgi:hypothetical protein
MHQQPPHTPLLASTSAAKSSHVCGAAAAQELSLEPSAALLAMPVLALRPAMTA